MSKKQALITGATAGIGLACADVLAARGYDLVLTGRREERLKEIAGRIGRETGVDVLTLVFDITSREATMSALQAQKDRISKTSVLINNAGLARGTERVPTADVDDWEAMIDTNVKGLLYVTRFCLPYMLERNEGDVVNLGSVAGRWVYPGGAVYCATKFAVGAITEGLRLDLQGTPIRVTNIMPGMVETEFSEVRLGDREKAKDVYKGMTPLSARDIAESIAWCLERPKHVNIQELVIFPTDQAGVGPTYVHRQP